VPQVAVALILLYVPRSGLLQVGTLADQLISVGVFPLLQVNAGGVIIVPTIPLAGTEPQVSLAGSTVNDPLQLAVFVIKPQVAVTLILLYVPSSGLSQSGDPSQLMTVAVSPLLQVKAGGAIATSEIPFAGTVPQASVTGVILEELGGAEEELLGSSSVEEEYGSSSADEEDGTTATDDEDDGSSSTDEEERTTTSDEEDGDDICRRVMFCTRVFPLPASGTKAYDVSKCPSADTVIVQSPGSAFSISEPEENFSFANATSIFIPPPLWVRRVVKALPPTPLTDRT
jgi:hypothetical protein